jgi:arylsulfatase A-like enzyme
MEKKLLPRKIRLLWFVPPGLLFSLALMTCSLVESTPPNVLMITVDALRADHLELYGYAKSTAPELSKLAERGAYFEAASAQAPLTVPSLLIMMTGRLLYHSSIPPGMTTLAERLKKRGYTTAAFIRNPLLELDRRGLERGFDTFFAPESLTDKNLSGREMRRVAEKQLYAKDFKAETLLAKADEWLQGNLDKQPFFLWIHLFDPHDPYLPPPPYDSQFDEVYAGGVDGDIRRTSKTDNPIWGIVKKNPPPEDREHIIALYDGEIRYTSAQIGAFLEKFAETNLAENTLTIFSSDHGESLGEHYMWGHGLSLYESELHIPLFMVMPGKIPPGTVISQPIESLDIVPTVLSLIGAKEDEKLIGKDLTPLFKGGSIDHPGVFARWSGEYSFRKGRWKLISGRKKGFKLYDLKTDPREARNLTSHNANILRSMESALMLKMSALREIAIDDKTGRTLRDKLKSLGYLE